MTTRTAYICSHMLCRRRLPRKTCNLTLVLGLVLGLVLDRCNPIVLDPYHRYIGFQSDDTKQFRVHPVLLHSTHEH